MGELQPILIGQLAKKWSLVILGPFPESRLHQFYILIAMEYGTRFCITKVVGKATAYFLIKFAEESIVWRFGALEKTLPTRGQ